MTRTLEVISMPSNRYEDRYNHITTWILPPLFELQVEDGNLYRVCVRYLQLLLLSFGVCTLRRG